MATRIHPATDESLQQIHTDLQALVAAGTTTYDAANLAATNALASATKAAQEAEYDRQVVMGTYAGRNLEAVFADEIAECANVAEWLNGRVTTGDFTGLRVFDYVDITLSDGKVFRYRIASVDPYLHACTPEITAHHVIMVPDQVWPDSVIWKSDNNNGTATYKNPYRASNLYTWYNDTFFPKLPQEWRSVIATHRALLEERYNASSTLNASSSWSWCDLGKVWAPSEKEVYGDVAWGTPGYSQGFDCHFSEFFKTTGDRIRRNHNGDRCSWWLRGVSGSSSSHACYVYGIGIAHSSSVSGTYVRALPCFRVGV